MASQLKCARYGCSIGTPFVESTVKTLVGKQAVIILLYQGRAELHANRFSLALGDSVTRHKVYPNCDLVLGHQTAANGSRRFF